MTRDELEASDRSKYGDKKNDLISKMFEVSFEAGVIWTIGNVKRYLLRFSREGSSKQGNRIDIEKSVNYLERLYEHFPVKSRILYDFEDLTDSELIKICEEYTTNILLAHERLEYAQRMRFVLEEILSRDSLFKVNKDIIE